MSKSVKAIYEDGVFKPLEPVTLNEHQHVVVSIPNTEKVAPDTEAMSGEVVHGQPQTGAELAAYWKQAEVFGSRPDITDSVAYAQALRREAGTREP